MTVPVPASAAEDYRRGVHVCQTHVRWTRASDADDARIGWRQLDWKPSQVNHTPQEVEKTTKQDQQNNAITKTNWSVKKEQWAKKPNDSRV